MAVASSERPRTAPASARNRSLRAASSAAARAACSRQGHALLGLTSHLFRHAVQVHEDADLGAQHVRRHRRQDVIDGPEGITLIQMHFIAQRRDEDDGRVFGLLAPADERRRLEAVHVGHFHVEQDDGVVPFQQPAQRLVAGSGRDHVLAEGFQDRFQGEQLVRQVVHDQDVDLVLGRHGASSLIVLRPRPAVGHAVHADRTGMHSMPYRSSPLNGTASRAAPKASARCPPAWTGNPRRRPRCISRGRPSWPWRSRR